MPPKHNKNKEYVAKKPTLKYKRGRSAPHDNTLFLGYENNNSLTQAKDLAYRVSKEFRQTLGKKAATINIAVNPKGKRTAPHQFLLRKPLSNSNKLIYADVNEDRLTHGHEYGTQITLMLQVIKEANHYDHDHITMVDVDATLHYEALRAAEEDCPDGQCSHYAGILKQHSNYF
jgi:hypothetical protein